MDMSIKPVQNNQINFNITPNKENESVSNKKVETPIKAEGAKGIGEEAFKKAIDELTKLLEVKEVSVNTSYDDNGLKQVSITDKNTGKKIIELPPDAAVKIAEKAKQNTIG